MYNHYNNSIVKSSDGEWDTARNIENKAKRTIGDINLANIPKYMGYGAGTWYDKDTFSPDARRRFGNLVTGTAIGGLGALSVPILQWLFPDKFAKFPGQGSRLAIAAMLGGIALPFALTVPAEIRAYNNYKAGIPNFSSKPKSEGDVKKGSVGQFDTGFPLMKSHLAASVLDEIRAGTMSTSTAAHFMSGIGQQTPPKQPWFTVGDVARAATGVGAGVVAGSTLGKGVSFFLGLTPRGRKNIRNVGMGLGALINTGKIGF